MSLETGSPDDEAPRRGDYPARSRATQQHILDAAVEVLVEAGYAGASTLQIQNRANVSRGRLLHQYPHRDALLVAAVQHLAEARIGAGGRTDWPKPPRRRVAAVVDAMWETYRQGYFWAATELWLAARHNEMLADTLRPQELSLGVSIRRTIDEWFGSELTAHPRYTDVRELLSTSMRGVALTYAFASRDPATDPHLKTWKGLAIRELDLD